MSEQATRYPLPLAPEQLAPLVPCAHGAGCPLGVDVPGIANAILAGDHGRAFALARAANPFASSCGHGCHAPCEHSCRRGRFGAPVAIGALEAFASAGAAPSIGAPSESCASPHDARSVAGARGLDLETAVTSPRSGHRIAIIGAGPAGLACAHDLVLLGHSPTVFDRRTEPGGTLAHLIPPSRFPRQSIHAEAAAILGMGVEFRREHGIQGPDAFITLLDEGYDAIFLAIGTPRARTLDLPGIGDIAAVPIDAVAVLSGEASPIGDVIVVGDDDLALDAAIVLANRPAAPAGREAGVVHLALSAAEGPLRARSGLMSRAARSGVVVHLGWAPAGISDETDGRVTVRLYRDGAADRLVCANAIVHAGRRDVGRVFGSALALRSDGLIETDPETLRTSHRRVWAGGACAFGHRSIAHAVADGKRAAWEIHGAITGGTIRIDVAFEWVEVGPDPLERAALSLRTHRALDTMQPIPTEPFNGEVTAQRAAHVLEAARCFDCTIVPMVDERCTRCGKCVSACPVGAFALTSGAEPQLTLDQSMCTRCGICVSACPEGAIAMVRGVWEARLVQSSRGEQLEHHPGDGARVALTVTQ